MSAHPARCALAVAIVRANHRQRVSPVPLRTVMGYLLDLEAKAVFLEARVAELEGELEDLTCELKEANNR